MNEYNVFFKSTTLVLAGLFLGLCVVGIPFDQMMPEFYRLVLRANCPVLFTLVRVVGGAFVSIPLLFYAWWHVAPENPSWLPPGKDTIKPAVDFIEKACKKTDSFTFHGTAKRNSGPRLPLFHTRLPFFYLSLLPSLVGRGSLLSHRTHIGLIRVCQFGGRKVMVAQGIWLDTALSYTN